ncbi:Translationally-controlled tumor protein [Pteropus alecto]|uniref:Translationally-controlled tumor protein n=3 Tax=Pteropus TaxID=9401 RepID=L5KH03_PTEAL|nr:Translationally-controlled tumor protein [Pteropus alecto]
MFSDIYKIREIADGLCLEVEGKMVSRTEGNIDDSLIGGNASAEGPDGEGTESTVITGVDIVMNHHLQETSFTKEAYKKYIKDYMKSIKGKLEEQRPERVKPFMTGAAEQIKHILANFKNYQFFIGENMNPDGMVALLDYREDGVTPYMIFFKDGLEMEKCKARITSLMLSVVMSLLLVVASGAQAVVCVGGGAVDEGLFSVWEASSAFEQEGYAGVKRSGPESSGMC